MIDENTGYGGCYQFNTDIIHTLKYTALFPENSAIEASETEAEIIIENIDSIIQFKYRVPPLTGEFMLVHVNLLVTLNDTNGTTVRRLNQRIMLQSSNGGNANVIQSLNKHVTTGLTFKQTDDTNTDDDLFDDISFVCIFVCDFLCVFFFVCFFDVFYLYY